YSSGPAITSNGTSDPEPSHELVIVDENGVEGANPTPDDVLTCGSAPVTKSAPLPTPADLVQRGEPITTTSPCQALGLSRIDPSVSSEPAGSIGLYFDPQGQLSCGSVAVGSPFTLYVVVRTDGPTRCGVSGTELRIATLPPDWLAAVVPVAGMVQV